MKKIALVVLVSLMLVIMSLPTAQAATPNQGVSQTLRQDLGMEVGLRPVYPPYPPYPISVVIDETSNDGWVTGVAIIRLPRGAEVLNISRETSGFGFSRMRVMKITENAHTEVQTVTSPNESLVFPMIGSQESLGCQITFWDFTPRGFVLTVKVNNKVEEWRYPQNGEFWQTGRGYVINEVTEVLAVVPK